MMGVAPTVQVKPAVNGAHPSDSLALPNGVAYSGAAQPAAQA